MEPETTANCGEADKRKVFEAAVLLVSAEKNFNQFAGNKDSVCNDKNLPATASLKGLIQKVDPRVPGNNVPNAGGPEQAAAAIVNARAEQVKTATLAAGTAPGNNGKSMAELLAVSFLLLFSFLLSF
jgi:hypothetical protein